jgi:hypothetical protein
MGRPKVFPTAQYIEFTWLYVQNTDILSQLAYTFLDSFTTRSYNSVRKIKQVTPQLVLEKATKYTKYTEPTRIPDSVTLSMQRKLRMSMTAKCTRALTHVVKHHC